ncbi:oxygenase MpaB family protein [Mycolicibacterium sp. XJ1819]
MSQPRQNRWTDTLLDGMRQVGDPLADGPVAAVLNRGGVDDVNAIMRTLVRLDQPVPTELPDELEDYLIHSLPLPVWADMAKIEKGQRLFETWGVVISVCLFCASLPSSYAAADGVKVLDMTARLDTDARRRVMETGQFLIDVLSRGGLDEDGKGRRTIQKVRLMHAAVRYLIKARNATEPGLWDPDWGEPINQEDLAGTLLAFSYIVIDPIRRLGVRLSAKDIEAYLHLWNVVGYLLGVREELLVRDAEDATGLVDAIRRRQFAPSPEGERMTEALLELLDDMTPGYSFDATIPPLIRHLIGDETADIIGVPKSGLVAHLGRISRIADWFATRVFGWSERESPLYRTMARLAHPLGRELLRTLFTLQRGGERAPFDIPTRLANRWEIPA